MGAIAFAGKTLIATRSKRQNTVEAPTYGAELNSGRAATEDSTEVWRVLRSLGAIVDEPTKFYGDNKAVFNSIAEDDGLCKKRHAAIAFHKFQEATAVGITRPHDVSSIENMSNFLTKALGRDKHNKATNRLLR